MYHRSFSAAQKHFNKALKALAMTTHCVVHHHGNAAENSFDLGSERSNIRLDWKYRVHLDTTRDYHGLTVLLSALRLEPRLRQEESCWMLRGFNRTPSESLRFPEPAIQSLSQATSKGKISKELIRILKKKMFWIICGFRYLLTFHLILKLSSRTALRCEMVLLPWVWKRK